MKFVLIALFLLLSSIALAQNYDPNYGYYRCGNSVRISSYVKVKLPDTKEKREIARQKFGCNPFQLLDEPVLAHETDVVHKVIGTIE